MIRNCLTLALLAAISTSAFALSNTFTYQGSLQDGAAPANGSYDLQFALQTQAGVPVGAALLRDDVVVTGGVFTVELDFGAGITGADFQLQIGVRPGASVGAFTSLSPATKIAPTPQAQVAGLAQEAITVSPGAIGAAQINQAQVQARVASSCPAGQSIRVVNANGTVTCEAAGSGPVGPQGPAGPTGATGPTGPAGATGPTGAQGVAGSVDAWGKNGTAAVAGQFIGTTNSEPLVLKASNATVLRITTNFNTANILAGSDLNSVDDTKRSQTVAGGGAGSASTRNATSADYATISGGSSNRASGDSSTVSGGGGNNASGVLSTVSGGNGHQASGRYSTVSGGSSNCAGGDYSWAGGRSAKIRPGNEGIDGTCVTSSGDADGDNGTFVWADDQLANFSSTGPNQFLVRAQGGMAINTNTPTAGAALTVAGNVSIPNPSRINFGSTTRQMLNLFEEVPANYGFGVQSGRLYSRTGLGGGFNWFVGGVHNDTADNPGAGGTWRMHLGSVGNLLTSTGTIGTLSDARLKDHVVDYTHALDRINALRPVNYHYKAAGTAAFQPEGTHVGFIAQEMQQVFPDWVLQGDDGYLQLSMRGFEAVAVRAMQELSAQDAEHSAQLADLQRENAALRERLAAIEAKLSR